MTLIVDSTCDVFKVVGRPVCPISQRTKEALARKRAEGVVLGRPKGRKSKQVKLSGKEAAIKTLLESGCSKSQIARLLKVHRVTLIRFLKNSVL